MHYLSSAKQYTQGAVFLSFREFPILFQKRLVHQRNNTITSAYYAKKIIASYSHIFWSRDNWKSWSMNTNPWISEIEIWSSLVRRLNPFDTKKWHKHSIHNNNCLNQYLLFSLYGCRGLEIQNHANSEDCSKHGNN